MKKYVDKYRLPHKDFETWFSLKNSQAQTSAILSFVYNNILRSKGIKAKLERGNVVASLRVTYKIFHNLSVENSA